MRAQKRISAPKTYNIKRKTSKWVTRVLPGAHGRESVSINVLLRDLIGLTRTAKEVKKVLHEGKLMIDETVKKNPRLPVGFMDSINIPSIKEYYRVIFNPRGKLTVIEISKSEVSQKLVQIKGKKRHAKHYQLITHDGRTINVKLSEGKKYSTRDSLLIKLPSQEIIKHLSFKEGMNCFITGGEHIGRQGVIKELSDQGVVIKNGDEELRTIKAYAFIIGEKKSELKLT